MVLSELIELGLCISAETVKACALIGLQLNRKLDGTFNEHRCTGTARFRRTVYMFQSLACHPVHASELSQTFGSCCNVTFAALDAYVEAFRVFIGEFLECWHSRLSGGAHGMLAR